MSPALPLKTSLRPSGSWANAESVKERAKINKETKSNFLLNIGLNPPYLR
jgi:hypothetical protein